MYMDGKVCVHQLPIAVKHYANVTVGSGKHNCRFPKYVYEKEVIMFLWCSGDIELNPGPIFKEFITFPKSYKERKWIQEMISNLLKTLKGIPENSKSKQLWKEKPDNWPPDMPFYDPRNKSAADTATYTSDEQILRCILKCCQSKNISLSSCYQQEIDAWKRGDINLLIELHISRQLIREIKQAIHVLYPYRDTKELETTLRKRKLKIDFSVHTCIYKSKKCKTDIIRDIAVTICKLCHQLDPLKKQDGIWKTPPHNWDMNKAFYSPHNAGKRREKNTDQNLLDNLLEYCESNNIPIPAEYKSIICAWKQNNDENLCKAYDIQTNIALIEHSLKYLQFEGLLNKPDIKTRLENIGLIFEWNSGKTTSENFASGRPITSKTQPIDHDVNMMVSIADELLQDYRGTQDRVLKLTVVTRTQYTLCDTLSVIILFYSFYYMRMKRW